MKLQKGHCIVGSRNRAFTGEEDHWKKKSRRTKLVSKQNGKLDQAREKKKWMGLDPVDGELWIGPREDVENRHRNGIKW